MPLTERDITNLPDAVPLDGVIEIRWSSLQSQEAGAWKDLERDQSDPYVRSSLVLSIQLLALDHAIFEAWLELPHGRTTLLPRQPLACRVSRDHSFLHIDCVHDGRRLIALSMTADEVAYAQSDLHAESGFGGGAFDPPTLTRLVATHEVASA